MTRWARKNIERNNKTKEKGSSWADLRYSVGEKTATHDQQPQQIQNRNSENRRLHRIQKRTNEKVCYGCRQKGHKLTDCPNGSKNQGLSSGICFKCGSTEHSISNCTSALPNNVFPFAKCFICQEMGHLSRDCPINSRGLYPNGGCCKICGSVKHLSKDCTEKNKNKSIAEVKLKSLSSCYSVDDEPTVVELNQNYSSKQININQDKTIKKKIVNF